MDDLGGVLRGAGPIAKVMYGADTKKNRRRVYYIAEKTKEEREKEGLAPIWKEGALLITTITALRDHYRPPNQKKDADAA
jgi:hypothetical protein